LVLVGISGFWGSEPFAVMIAAVLAEEVLSEPLLAQPDSASTLAATSATAPMPYRLIFNFPPVQKCGKGNTPS